MIFFPPERRYKLEFVILSPQRTGARGRAVFPLLLSSLVGIPNTGDSGKDLSMPSKESVALD